MHWPWPIPSNLTKFPRASQLFQSLLVWNKWHLSAFISIHSKHSVHCPLSPFLTFYTMDIGNRACLVTTRPAYIDENHACLDVHSPPADPKRYIPTSGYDRRSWNIFLFASKHLKTCAIRAFPCVLLLYARLPLSRMIESFFYPCPNFSKVPNFFALPIFFVWHVCFARGPGHYSNYSWSWTIGTQGTHTCTHACTHVLNICPPPP